jgi:hypothetical protein
MGCGPPALKSGTKMVRRRRRIGALREEFGIILRRVRRVATGRIRRGTRVLFRCHDGRLVTSERLILRHARQAKYGAYRLPPYLWRLLPHVAPPGVDWGPLPPMLDGDEIRLSLLRRRGALLGTVTHLPSSRLRQLAIRHSGPDVNPRRPGVPDLLVFKTTQRGKPYGFRFVEVKRANERLGRHQHAEISSMRSLGFKAGVLRLIERPGGR